MWWERPMPVEEAKKLTSYIDIETMPRLPHNEKYTDLCEYLASLRKHYIPDKSQYGMEGLYSIYEVMLGRRKQWEPTDFVVDSFHSKCPLFDDVTAVYGKNFARTYYIINPGSDWAIFHAYRNKDDNTATQRNIKVYISTGSSKVKDLFLHLLEVLLDHVSSSFACKVARRMRKDSMCFWVSRQDFLLLEEEVKKSGATIVCDMPFLPYRGNLGISRELGYWDSHNQMQAQLIADYFAILPENKQPDIEDMYQLMLDIWHGKKEEGSTACGFRRAPASVIVMLLESLDVILGSKKLSDDSVLMSDDKDFWETLGNMGQDREWYGER